MDIKHFKMVGLMATTQDLKSIVDVGYPAYLVTELWR